jgi:hypothetical protein
MIRYILTGIVLVVSFTAVQARAATWYVATNGNDSNSCSSLSAPCLTINSAYQKANGGDTIQMAAGTYASQTIDAKTPTSTIVVHPAAGASVTLGGLNLNGCKRLEIRDVTTGGFGARNVATQYVTLRNVKQTSAFFLNAGSDISIIGGSVGPEVDQQAQIAPTTGRWSTSGGGNNFLIDGVYFHDFVLKTPGTHMECLQVSGTTNMIIRNSKFENCAIFDLSFTDYNGGADPVRNVTVENNYFDAATAGGYFSVHFTATTGAVVRFNSATQAMVIGAEHGSVSGFVLTGNDVIGGILNGDSGGCNSTSIATYNYNVTPGVKCGSTDLNAAAGFVNPAILDLHLAATAAAIDFVPTSVSGGCPATDMNGNKRPAGAACDAGASEYEATSGPPAPTGLQVIVN